MVAGEQGKVLEFWIRRSRATAFASVYGTGKEEGPRKVMVVWTRMKFAGLHCDAGDRFDLELRVRHVNFEMPGRGIE